MLTKDDIAKIVNAAIIETDVAIREELINSIFEQQELDWQNKDSGVSRIRRTTTKVLSEALSAVEAKSKANEVVNSLLEVQ